MDAKRFDDLLRSLFERPTRRGIGRTLAGLAFGGARGRLGPIEAEAKKKKRKKCKGGKKKCGKQCFDLQTNLLHCGSCGNACDDDMVCRDGVCVCPVGTDECGETCADLATDEANCGACGNQCGSGEICVTGFCLTSCANPSPQNPLSSCPADPGGICVTVAGIGVCVRNEDPSCVPFARESCDGDPCPDGRVCANLLCGPDQFLCVVPAQGVD